MTGIVNSAGARSGVIGKTFLFKNYELWVLTAALNRTNQPITTNWYSASIDSSDHFTTRPFGAIGAGMTQSSGVFTFPVTGIWHIECCGAVSSTEDPVWIEAYAAISPNSGTNFYTAQATSTNVYHDATAYSHITSSFTQDVTNASTTRFRWGIDMEPGHNLTIAGSTSQIVTYVAFTRIGDT